MTKKLLLSKQNDKKVKPLKVRIEQRFVGAILIFPNKTVLTLDPFSTPKEYTVADWYFPGETYTITEYESNVEMFTDISENFTDFQHGRPSRPGVYGELTFTVKDPTEFNYSADNYIIIR